MRARDHGGAAAAGQVHVEQDDVGPLAGDHLDGLEHVARLADDVDAPGELRPHARADELVVVDHDDAQHHEAVLERQAQLDLGSLAGRRRDRRAAAEPLHATDRSTRGDPRGPAPTPSGTKPRPVSRTNTASPVGVVLREHVDASGVRRAWRR